MRDVCIGTGGEEIIAARKRAKKVLMSHRARLLARSKPETTEGKRCIAFIKALLFYIALNKFLYIYIMFIEYSHASCANRLIAHSRVSIFII